MSTKPTILWLADMPGWAYDQIFTNVSKVLAGYEHEVFYMMQRREGPGDWLALGDRIRAVDVIVVMHWMYLQMLPLPTEKVVMMVTGHRGLEE